MQAGVGGGTMVLGLVAWWLHAGWLLVAVVALPAALAARIDVTERRLPNPLVLLSALPTVAACVAQTIDTGVAAVVPAALGGAAMAGAPMITHAIAPTSLGFGDVKLAAALGLSLGTFAPHLGLVALAAAAGVAAAVAIARRQTELPFGPSLLVGYVVVAVGAHWSITMFGISSTGWSRW